MVSESIVAMMVEHRKKHGWSQYAFGQKLHVSERTIRRYERGEATPTLDVVEEFAAISGHTVSELVAEETEAERRKRKFLDDVWDAHLKHFDSSRYTPNQTEEE